jgi:hypothetical protein
MRSLRLTAGMAMAVLVWCGSAQAGPVYSYLFDQSNYTVAAGGTVLVKVSLQEDTSTGGPSLLSTEGLISAGVRVDFNDPVPTQPAQVRSLADILPNPAFDLAPPPDPRFLPVPGFPNTAGIEEYVDIASPPVTAPGTGPLYQIPLGSFLFHAGSVPGEVTHIQALDFNPATDDTVTALTATVLDSLINPANATITVQPAAVPEPSGLVLFGLAFSALMLRARRVRA